MKVSCLIFATFACAVATLPAQTNTSANTNAGTNASTASNGVESILALVTTNRPAASPATNQSAARPRGPIFIHSAGPAVVDMENHWVTYSDSVLVTNPDMKLTCEWAKANFTADWRQPTNVVAETNVVVDYIDPKGEKGRATGTNATYLFQVQKGVTNETITLTGDPPEILEGPNYTNVTTADEIIYDLMTRKVTLSGPSGTYWRTTTNATGSNSPPQGDFPFAK